MRRKLEFEKKLEGNVPIILVDCDFPNLQTSREIKSLAQQLMYTYGRNKSAAYPMQLLFAGIFPELATALSRVSGIENWAGAKLTSTSPFGFLHEKAVYLSADSTETLTSLDDYDCYIIGGIVDRNRYNGITEQRAREWGIPTAKLPLHKFVKLQGSRVLTVNQVFDILSFARDAAVAAAENSSDDFWGEAVIKAIPARKMIKVCNSPNDKI